MIKSLTKKRSQRTQSRSYLYQNLEPRQMLAGVVTAQLLSSSLYIRGDELGNSIVVNLNAETAEEFVQGIDGTQVEMFGFDSGAQIDKVSVVLNGGDDSVVVDGTGTRIMGDFFASMGDGNNELTVVGQPDDRFLVRGNFRAVGMDGTDNFLVSGVYTRGNLTLDGKGGDDSLTVRSIQVRNFTTIVGGAGSDSTLVDFSRFSSNFGVRGGLGGDWLGIANSIVVGNSRFFGSDGTDSHFFGDSNRVARPFLTSLVETTFDAPNDGGFAQQSIDDLGNWLQVDSDSMDDGAADLFQDCLTEIADAFDVNFIELELDAVAQTVSVNDPTPTVSVLWDQIVQQAVVNTGPGPTIASRAYGMMHTAMYDAWSAYNETAISTLLGDDHQQPADQNTDANKAQAMSFAAYRVLEDLFSSEVDLFDELMEDLGYDPSNISADPNHPTSIGAAMADALLAARHNDGSNQLGTDPSGNGQPYSDITGYEPVNQPGGIVQMEAWTPEFVPIDGSTGDPVQQFLTPHWGEVDAFALDSGDQFQPVAPEPFLLVDGTVDLDAQTIELSDGTVLDIEPGLVGTVINPAFITQAEEVVNFSANLTDQEKLIAEFWEDGGGTSFPPGTFMTFAQFVSARDNNSLDQDAQMFFAMGNAVFDAGVATWNAKVHYDYVRPVRAIRELGELGLIGTFDANLGGHAILAWVPGQGAQTILVSEFLTYQTPGSDPSPPFAEYTSGHSAFSAAGANILRMFTGSDEFDASVTFSAGDSRFEPGQTPVVETTLSWETFTAAADEAGLSRLYGGIHFEDGDINGRTLGADVAEAVWDQTQFFINGGNG